MSETAASREKHKMTSRVSVAIIAATVSVALAFALNPSPEKHREKIKETIAQRSQLERILGIGQLTSFISKYHSVGIGSYTTVNEKVASIGVFGMVFVQE